MHIKTLLAVFAHIFIPTIAGGALFYFLNFSYDLVENYKEPSYVYYYSFSTVVQGFVAILAFLGALALFKLQRDETEKQRLLNDAKPYLENQIATEAIGKTSKELIEKCKKFFESPSEGRNFKKIKEIYPSISALEEAQRQLTIDLNRFSRVCIADVAMALVGILFIPAFNSNMSGPIYLGGNIALSIYVLFLSLPVTQRILRLAP